MIRRLVFLFSALLIIALLILAYSFYGLQKSAGDLLSAEERASKSYEIANRLQQSSADLSTASRAYAITGDSKFEFVYNQVAAIRDGDRDIPKEYNFSYWDDFFAGKPLPIETSGIKRSLENRAIDAGMTEKEVDLLRQSYASSQELKNVETEAFNAVKGIFKNNEGLYARIAMPDLSFAQGILHDDNYYQGKVKVMHAIDEFYKLVDSEVKAEIEEQDVIQSNFRLLFVISSIISLLIIFAVIFMVVVQNKRDLADRTALQKAAEDENDQLNDSVINLLEAVNSLSQRDLTATAPVTEDIIGTVSDSINGLTSETARVLHGVTKIAGQVSIVSGNVKKQADQVTETAEQERENVQGMVNSLLDATQTMNQVAALAEQSNDSAGQASKITNEALISVNDTVTGMESIRETISETEKRIKRLGERSQEISGIVNLINTISERTHVLALNASMQAAVAGEAGRGFAVVAEEVQRLAESSRNATQQIATLVSNIQVETNETINTVNETIGQVVEGSAQAQRAGEQMKLTQEITEQLVSQVQSIAKASDQQKEMSVVLLESVQRIGESTEQTEQQIQEQNKETDALLEASDALVDSVSVFKLPTQVSA